MLAYASITFFCNSTLFRLHIRNMWFYFLLWLGFLASVGARCRFDKDECTRLVTVINNDYDFASRVYRKQMDSVICFATRHGYGYDQIDPRDYKECDPYTVFFFAKHCAVKEYLKQRVRYKAWVLVLDGDVSEAVPSVSLENFLSSQSDLQFYDRSWSSEIVSGNYFVRNTVFSHAFLQGWADFEKIRPIGFSSADNGALHAHLADTLRMLPKYCVEGYHRLNHTVKHLDPYFTWVKSCRENGLFSGVVAPGRVNSFVGNITFLSKYQGPVADYVYVNSNVRQPPLYHGIKNQDLLRKKNGCWFINSPK